MEQLVRWDDNKLTIYTKTILQFPLKAKHIR